jgi:hypothetical protein
MFEPEFVSKVLEAFSKIKGEIDEKGGEFLSCGHIGFTS